MQRKEEHNKYNSLLLIHSVLGIATLLLVLLVFSLFISAEIIPSKFMNSISFFSVFCGSLAASSISAVKFGKKLITALIQGILYFSLIHLIGAVIYGSWFPVTISFYVPLSCLSGSLLGAIFSTFFKKRKH